MNVMLMIVVVTSVVITVFINVVDALMDGGEKLSECIHDGGNINDILRLSALRFLKDSS